MKNSYITLLSSFLLIFCFSNNGVAQWNIVDIGTTIQLYDVHFIDNNNGWIVGDDTVFKTEDGGANWVANSTIPDTRYYGLYFKDALNGWAVGKKKTASTAGRVHFTTDGGLTWQVYFTSGSLPWWSVAFSEDGMNGILVGQEGQSRFTTDGGLNWFPRTLPSGDAGIIKDVTFYDGINAIAVGYDAGQGVIMKTTDGGNSWTNIVTNLPSQLNSVSFRDSLNGIAVGSGGNIYKTTDGGDTWTEKVSNTTNTLNGINYYDENRAIAVGNSGTVVGSNDDGETWTIEDVGTTFNLRNVYKSGAANAYAVGPAGTVIKDNCVQSGQIVFTNSSTEPLIANGLSADTKIFFYYEVEDNENTPPLCTVVEDPVFFNGELAIIGARYLGSGLLQCWIDFVGEVNLNTLTISLPDSISDDGISITFDEVTRPPDFVINLSPRTDIKESITLFAGGSVGLSAIEGGVGIGPASIALAKQTIKGTAGMSLKFENDLSGNQIITRSFEFGAGLTAEIPTISAPVPLIGDPDPEASVFVKGIFGQSMKFSDTSDTTKKAKAAYLLETFGIGNIPLSPFAGVYIIALKNALVDLNPDLPDLYSTYQNSDVYGLGVEGDVSVNYGVSFLNAEFKFLELALNASLSATLENFTNNTRALSIDLASAFNMSALDLTVASNSVDLGQKYDFFDFGGKVGITGEYNTLSNQINNLVLSYSNSESSSFTFEQLTLTRAKTRDYQFIIPETVISNNSTANNIIGVTSDLLTVGTSTKTLDIGVNAFTSNLETIYADNPISLGTYEEHNLLEVKDTELIGVKNSIGIDLTAAIGVGIGVELGMELGYFTELSYLEGQYIVANDTILPTKKMPPYFGNVITLNNEVTDLFDGTTLLLDGAFDELITTAEQNIQDGVDFVVEIGDSAAELTGNLISDGEKWVLRWLDPSYTTIFNRGPNFTSESAQVYISRINPEISETTTNAINNTTLYIVSNNLNTNLLDVNNNPILTFDPVNLSLTIDQTKIDQLGFTDAEKALAKLYKFDESTLSWIELNGDSDPSLDIVETAITDSGNYAIGINYNNSLDANAPEIPEFFPTEGSTIPAVEEHWAELFEPITGVGLDLAQTIIKIDDIEVPVTWDPINERVLYTPETPLSDGAHTFEVIVQDLNGNSNSIFSNYVVDSSLGIDVAEINELKVYPNPARNILNMRGNLSLLNTVEIYNIQGQRVKRILSGFEQMDISDLKPALYFVKLSSSEGQRIIKIIKK